MPLAMARADAALYAAKRSGRNQLRVGDAHALVE
jgi:PleD family two-component response regulator